jgi:shikimate dehydrogenase
MPLKEAVLPALMQMTPMVALCRSANTVVFSEGGPVGHNTDVAGFVAALSERQVVHVESAAVLGTGATARSALLALQQMGATEVTLVGRLGDSLPVSAALAQDLGLQVRVLPWEEASEALGAPLVINTAPASAGAEVLTLLPVTPGLLFEVIYDPTPTPLSQAWEQRGGDVIGGLDLLVHQALEQIRLMTGQSVSAEILRQGLQGA